MLQMYPTVINIQYRLELVKLAVVSFMFQCIFLVWPSPFNDPDMRPIYVALLYFLYSKISIPPLFFCVPGNTHTTPITLFSISEITQCDNGLKPSIFCTIQICRGEQQRNLKIESPLSTQSKIP